MKKGKKFLSFSLALLLALGCLPMSSSAAVTVKEFIPPQYDMALSFFEGLAVVSVGGKDGVIDKTGKEIVPPKYDWIESFSEGFASVNVGGDNSGGWADGGKWGIIDRIGTEVFPLSMTMWNLFPTAWPW